MNNKVSFIGITYKELESLPIDILEERILQEIKPYFEKINKMNLAEKIRMREDVKNARKMDFRFSQEITKDIPKIRIQIALSHLAKLFQRLDGEIKKSEQRNA